MKKKQKRLFKIVAVVGVLCVASFLSEAHGQKNTFDDIRLEAKKIDPCALGLAQAPVVNGVRLGMSREEAENTLKIKMLNASIAAEDKRIGLEVLSFFRVRVNRYPASLDGIESVELRFFADQLYDFRVGFVDTGARKNIEDLTRSISADFNLPPGGWQTNGSSTARMSCQGFTVEANTYVLHEISVSDNFLSNEVERKRREERARLVN